MAAKANIVIDQGADFSTTITVTDDAGDAVDLTGYTGEGQIRKHYTSTTSTAFTVSFDAPRSDGQITLSLGRTVTANMESGRYVYDVLVSSGNTFYTLVNGNILVRPGVSSITSL